MPYTVGYDSWVVKVLPSTKASGVVLTKKHKYTVIWFKIYPTRATRGPKSRHPTDGQVDRESAGIAAGALRVRGGVQPAARLTRVALNSWIIVIFVLLPKVPLWREFVICVSDLNFFMSSQFASSVCLNYRHENTKCFRLPDSFFLQDKDQGKLWDWRQSD